MPFAATQNPSPGSPSPSTPAPHVPADFYHTRRRLRERYGLHLELYQIARLSRAIARSDPSCVVLRYEPKPSPGRLLVAMPVEGRWVLFVWGLGTKRIITALPEFYLEPWADVLDETAAGWAARQTA